MSRDTGHRSRKAMVRLAILAALVLLVAVIHARRSASARSATGDVRSQGDLLLTRTARAEACAIKTNGRFTSNLGDLNALPGESLRAEASRAHLSIKVSVGANGQSFYARASGRGFNDYVQQTATLAEAATVRCRSS